MRTILVALIFCASRIATGQSAGGPKPRALGKVFASSRMTLPSVSHVRGLSDGRVVVNDDLTRLVWIFEASLATARVIIDSAPGLPNSYGRRGGGLLAGLADSTLFLDSGSQTFVVFDAGGAVGRAMAIPPGDRSSVASVLTGVRSGMGIAQITPSFGLVYRTPRTTLGDAIPPRAMRGTGFTPSHDDSSAVLAMSIVSRTIDTLAVLTMGSTTRYALSPEKAPAEGRVPRLFTFTDQWAVTSDGSLAVLREREYRIEWVGADRKHALSPRLPYPWQAVSDKRKTQLIDSANAESKRRNDQARAKQQADSVARHGQPVPLGAGIFYLVLSVPTHYAIDDVPDYYPPTIQGPRTMLADGDNNVWIHIQYPGIDDATPVYDVVNRQGVLVDRVRLPSGHTLMGFSPGGIVFLTSRDGGKTILKKARFK